MRRLEPGETGTRETEPGIGHLRHFAARAGRAGRGIGRLLYERCEAEARAAGVTTPDVFSSRNAEPFYAAMGFVTIGPIDVAMADGSILPSIHMRRST